MRQLQVVKTVSISATPMVYEGSFGTRNAGSHASTMTMYKDGDSYLIEWHIPGLDEVTQIGLWFEGKSLTDYDGVYSLPKEAAALIRKCGFKVSKEFET